MRSAEVCGGRFIVREDGSLFKKKGDKCEPYKPHDGGPFGQYLMLSYSENHKQVQKNVHRIVAEQFVPNPDNLPFVKHKNGDTKDNRAENLYWASGRNNHRFVGKGTVLAERGFPCKRCGTLIVSKTGYCKDCKAAVIRERRKEAKLEKWTDRFQNIDLSVCSETERKYVLLARQGLGATEIAERYGVSRQCVSKALSNSEDKMALGVTPGSSYRSAIVRAERSVAKRKTIYDKAAREKIKTFERYLDSVSRLEALKKRAGVT